LDTHHRGARPDGLAKGMAMKLDRDARDALWEKLNPKWHVPLLSVWMTRKMFDALLSDIERQMEGLKLAPIEPDEDMCKRFFSVYHGNGESFRLAYRAMHAAAPSASQSSATEQAPTVDQTHLGSGDGPALAAEHCDECDPSYGCFDGSAVCSKKPLAEPESETPLPIARIRTGRLEWAIPYDDPRYEFGNEDLFTRTDLERAILQEMEECFDACQCIRMKYHACRIEPSEAFECEEAIRARIAEIKKVSET